MLSDLFKFYSANKTVVVNDLEINLSIEDYKLRAASFLFQFIDLSLFEDSELEAICQLKIEAVAGSVDPYLKLLFQHIGLYWKDKWL
jgi:hypothetical protein